MNDLQIDYFMAVATNLSFTKTSEELYVSQPAISKQIAMLEKELGVKLFSRSSKRIRLTEAGQLYYKLFSDFKLEFRNVQHQTALLQNGNIDELHIGFLEGWDLSGIIPKLVERFQETYPRTRLFFDCCGAKEISTLLLTGGIEVALTLENSLYDFSEIETVRVAELQKLLVYSVNSRFARSEGLQIRDFREETIFAPWGVAEKMITRIIDSYFQPYGFTPELQFVHNNESMITCVRNALGVAVSDEWSWAIRAEDLRFLPIDAKDAICVATMKNIISEYAAFAAEILAEIVQDLR